MKVPANSNLPLPMKSIGIALLAFIVASGSVSADDRAISPHDLRRPAAMAVTADSFLVASRETGSIARINQQRLVVTEEVRIARRLGSGVAVVRW